MYGGDSKVENISLVVAAAGVGKRMGLGYPKQFLEYEGKPLF
ncbi:MAG: 2-C-methyl-D-erythritol 4-phosphate cytidylyltransferase, partial [Cetobacterium sp.]